MLHHWDENPKIHDCWRCGLACNCAEIDEDGVGDCANCDRCSEADWREIRRREWAKRRCPSSRLVRTDCGCDVCEAVRMGAVPVGR